MLADAIAEDNAGSKSGQVSEQGDIATPEISSLTSTGYVRLLTSVQVFRASILVVLYTSL